LPKIGIELAPGHHYFIRKSMAALNHSFCQLLLLKQILSAEMAIFHSKSDRRVTGNTGVFRFLSGWGFESVFKIGACGG